jgi:oligopeptide/dipeptide ABC transporter ATP-binding protein
MYAGKIVERSPAEPLFTRPVHPYTEALLSSICRLESDVTRPITAIPGQPPLPQQLPSGCPFQPRCPHAIQRCVEEVPAVHTLSDGRTAECHLAETRAEVAA